MNWVFTLSLILIEFFPNGEPYDVHVKTESFGLSYEYCMLVKKNSEIVYKNKEWVVFKSAECTDGSEFIEDEND